MLGQNADIPATLEFMARVEPDFPMVSRPAWDYYATQLKGLTPSWSTRFYRAAKRLEGEIPTLDESTQQDPLNMTLVRDGMRSIESGELVLNQDQLGAKAWNTIADLNNMFTVTGVGKILGWDYRIHGQFESYTDERRLAAASELSARYIPLVTRIELV